MALAQGVPDSILTKVFSLQNDSARVSYLNDLSLELAPTNPQVAYSVAYYALGLSSNIKNDEIRASTFQNMGMLSAGRNETKAARTFYRQAAHLYEQLQDSLSLGYLHRNVGISFAQEGMADSSFLSYIISLSYLKNPEFRYFRALTEIELAKGLYTSKKPEQAMEYIQGALPVVEANNDLQALAAGYNLLGLLKYDEESPESGDYFRKARQLSEKVGDSVSAAIHAFNLGLSYEQMGDFQGALDQFNRTAPKLERYGITHLMPVLWVNQGLVLLSLNPNDSLAVGSIQKGVNKARSTRDYRTAEKGLAGLVEHYKKIGNPERALGVQQELIEVMNQQSKQNLEDLMRRVENDNRLNRQRREIDLLKLEEKISNQMLREKDIQRYRLLAGLGLALLLIVSFYFLYRHIRRQNKVLNAQFDEIQTQRKKLSKLNKSKDRLFAIIGHDLRGPIGNIARLLTLIPTERDFLTEDSQSTLEVAKAGMVETHNLLENLLIWAKSQNENISLDIRKQKIGPLIERSIQLQKPHLNLKHIKVSSEFPSEMTGQFDYDILYTVIRNLLSNAIKFAPEDSEIKIQAHPAASGKGIEIDVIDQGGGIPEPVIEALEKDLEDHDQKASGNIRSNGMGLKLCKDLLQFNAGKLQVINTESGARVRVSLPG